MIKNMTEEMIRKQIEKASAYIDENREAMMALWEKLVSCESGNPDKEDVDRICEILKDELDRSGVKTATVQMEGGGNLPEFATC